MARSNYDTPINPVLHYMFKIIYGPVLRNAEQSLSVLPRGQPLFPANYFVPGSLLMKYVDALTSRIVI